MSSIETQEYASAVSPPAPPDWVSAGVQSVLVAIASYGRKQDHFLARVIAELRKLPVPCRIVVLTEAMKPVPEAEVLVGVPSRNPYSLPFAHRKLFAENVDNHDLFVYTEDDTLLTAAHIEAFLECQRHLKEDEIVGFVRSERSDDGERFITSINHFFRWLPDSIEARGGELFARFSNNHSGCFVATQAQLRRALASGRFLVEPHDEFYGMLESAASDIYTQCGLRRLICLSRIDDFIVPHLPNKYFREMGVPLEDLRAQVRALSAVHRRNAWLGELYQAQTRAFGFRWSQNLYERPDEAVLDAVQAGARRVLTVGAAGGQLERALKATGIDVHAVALDAVFAHVLLEAGIPTVVGPFEDAIRRLPPGTFDVVFVAGLHLVPRPVEWLQQLRGLVADKGCLIARAANTGEVSSWVADLRQGRYRGRMPRYGRVGAHPVSPRILRAWFAAAGFRQVEVVSRLADGRRQRLGPLVSRALSPWLASSFLVSASDCA